jgi:phage baseplate assembly protein W
MSLDGDSLDQIVQYAPRVKVLNLSLWQTIKGSDLLTLASLTNLKVRHTFLTDSGVVSDGL